MCNSDDRTGELDFQKGLHGILWDHLPNHRRAGDGKALDAAKIARDLNISSKAYYAWFQRKRLSHRRIASLTKLEGSTLTVELLFPFTFQN
jgi:hypothetical protein